MSLLEKINEHKKVTDGILKELRERQAKEIEAAGDTYIDGLEKIVVGATDKEFAELLADKENELDVIEVMAMITMRGKAKHTDGKSSVNVFVL